MIRTAKVSDSKIIQQLVNKYAKQGEMLNLSLNEIFERLYEFVLWEENGEVIGVAALHPMWEDVAEVRSLAIDDKARGKGVGKALVLFLLDRAREMGFNKVFALTYKEEFFRKCGFEVTSVETLPKKIWTDCLKCVKYPNCDETAVIINV